MDGEWEPPVIQNPEYKVQLPPLLNRSLWNEGGGAVTPSSPLRLPQGEWRPRQIDNPDYKGKWVHPEIDNPEYTPDPSLYAYDSFGVIGLDLWQVGRGGGGRGWGAQQPPERRPSPPAS